MRRLSLLAIAAVAGTVMSGCASPPRRADLALHGPSRAVSDSAITDAARPASLRCPITTPPVEPNAGATGAPLAPNPTGALECVTNEPAAKRVATDAGQPLPASIAVVLARLLDQAVPADAATSRHCAPVRPLTVTRFGYPSGPVDVIDSSHCSASHVAYIHNHAYVLPTLLASYLFGAPDPAATFSPLLVGQTMAHAAATARRVGDQVDYAGELFDASAADTVLLQYPTLDHQVGIIAAVGHSPACRAGQLAIQYLPGGAGTGSDFGTILLRNISASWCQLDGSAAITGLAAGRPVTKTVTVTVAGDLELSPRAAAAVPGQALPADQLAASLLLSAEYRDDTDGRMCTPHWIVPKVWRVVLDAITLTVANGRATANARPPGAGGLITCRGHFGGGPIRIAMD